MGVSGCGKTTLGRLLSEQIGWPFFDGDDYHPPANIEKMSRGFPLTDTDRAGWLDQLAGLLREQRRAEQSCILACSALKSAYRQRLAIGPEVRFVYLQGEYTLFFERLQRRQGHYMKANLLESQFAALEEPQDALVIPAAAPLANQADLIRSAFYL
jgi:gluconokinase